MLSSTYDDHIHLQETDLRDKSYLDAVNNILSTGSCPLLFTEEELRSLIAVRIQVLQAMRHCYD